MVCSFKIRFFLLTNLICLFGVSQLGYNKYFQDAVTYEDLMLLDACVTSDQGSIAVGFIDDGPFHQALAIKLDANGDTLWVRRIDESLHSFYSSVEVDANGDILIAGAHDVWPSLTKIDNSGNVFWAKKLNVDGPNSNKIEYIQDVGNWYPSEQPQLDVDGTDIIFGTVAKTAFRDFARFNIAKVNSSGSLLWSKTFDFMNNLAGSQLYNTTEGHLSSIEVLSNGNFIITGGLQAGFSGKYSYTVLLDGNGDFINKHVYYNSNVYVSRYHNALESSSGEILVLGRGENIPGSTSSGFFIVRFDGSLNYISTLQYSQYENLIDIINANDGGYYGLYYNSQSADMGLVKLDSLFEVQWSKIYGSSMLDQVVALDNFSNGDLLLAGYTNGWGGGNYKGYLLRSDSEGVVPGCYKVGTYIGHEELSFPNGALSENNGGAGNLFNTVGPTASVVLEMNDVNIEYTVNLDNPPCPGDQGSVEISVLSTNSPYTFVWSNGTSANEINEFEGIYSVSIRDNFGCVEQDTFELMDPLPLEASAVSSGVTCYGFGDASIDLSVTGGTPGYNFDWTTGQSTEDLNNISGGFYQVTVSDSNGCVDVVGVSVSEPTPLTAIVSSTTNVSCYGQCDGRLVGFGSGGIAPYQYAWNDVAMQTADTAFNLCYGNYVLTLTDNNGCLAYSNATISEPIPIQNSVTAFESDCFSSNGYAIASTSGGTAPYMFNWDGTGLVSDDSIGNLEIGNYTLQIEDANGCVYNDVFGISSNTNPIDICVITVDSNNQNLIVWEKPVAINIAGFNIYRNIAGVYTQVGYQPYSSISQFVDNDFGVDPDVTSYRYKISVLDSCGNESALSDFHETIHLTANLGVGGEVNLIWDDYEGFNFSEYGIWRDSTGNGDWEQIGTTLSTGFTYTDNNVPSNAVNLIYAIEVVLPGTCTAERAIDHNSTRSNQSTIAGPGAELASSVEELILQNMRVYPNPMSDQFTISLNANDWSYQLMDVSGRIIGSGISTGTTTNVDVSHLESGIYLINVELNGQFVTKKMLKQ